MAVETIRLLFKGNRDFGIESDIGVITFDLILSEAHNLSNDVTEHVVEDGSRITDHIKNNLENGSLSGLITNFSIKRKFEPGNFAQDAHDEMKRIWKSRELVTITTIMEKYENVAITNIDEARSEETGEATVLNVTFKKVEIKKLKTTLIDANVRQKDMNDDTNRQASPKLEVGTTTGT